MRESGLQGRQKRLYRVRTTDSRHDEPIAPNRLALAATPTKPDEAWGSDITCVETAEGWLYLAGVPDLYNQPTGRLGHGIGQTITAIFDYIEGFYNRTHPHSALGFKSPPLDDESNLSEPTITLDAYPFYQGKHADNILVARHGSVLGPNRLSATIHRL